MKKSILMVSVLMMLMACGGQTKKEASDADSTQVLEVPDTLSAVEAVIKQVDAVYEYWNELRLHYDEDKPTVDELFGTKEWQQVREDANDIEAKILPDGTAEVKFLVKDAVTPKGIPMRWLMRVEDGEWRVANIIFEKDGGIDLLESLRDYGREFKAKKQSDSIDIEREPDLSEYAE